MAWGGLVPGALRSTQAPGLSVDGKGEFSFTKIKPPTDDDGRLGQVDPRIYGTPAAPVPAAAAE